MSKDIKKLDDDLLKSVAVRVNQLMLEDFDASAPEEEYVPSEKFQKSAREIIENPGDREIYRTRRYSRSAKRLLLIAALLAALLTVGVVGTGADGAPANPKEVFNFSRLFAPDCIEINFLNDVKDNVSEEEFRNIPHVITSFYEPTYIPEGLQITDRDCDDFWDYGLFEIDYNQSDQSIRPRDKVNLMYKQRVLYLDLWFHAPRSPVHEIQINGCTGYCTEITRAYCDGEKTESRLIWHDNRYWYEISGELPLEEIIKIAQSVEPSSYTTNENEGEKNEEKNPIRRSLAAFPCDPVRSQCIRLCRR